MDFDEHEVQEEEIEMEAAAASGLGNSGVSSGGRSSGVVGGGVKYKECLKNHAVAIGGHAVDGCCEFMAAGEEGTLDALKCAACNCHRNFHRKEVGSGGFQHQHIIPPPPPSSSHHHHPSSGVAHFSAYSFRSPTHPMGHLQARTLYEHNNTDIQLLPNRRPLALPSTSRDDEDMSNPSSSGGGGGGGGGDGGGSKKRFRTKFSQEQKEKMLAFAEKIGWRIQKQDEAAVQQFCAESNVRRHVLKVWMHNNKHTLRGGMN